MDALQLKEEGNKHFNAGSFADALSCYTKALELNDEDTLASEKAVLYKNRAACYLKLNEFQNAAKDASLALEQAPMDPKSLFRRCQALDLLGKHEDAYKDALALLQIEPNNKAILPTMQKLSALLQEKSRKLNSTDNQISQMFDLAFSSASGDAKKRVQALNNLLVLAREESGAEKIFMAGGIQKLRDILESKDPELMTPAIRILSYLAKRCKHRAIAILSLMGLMRIIAMFSYPEIDFCNANSALVQALLNGISSIEKYRDEKAKFEADRQRSDGGTNQRFKPLVLADDEREYVDSILNSLVKMINSHKMSAAGRDCVLELLIRNFSSADGFNWVRRFLETDGSARIMEIAGMMPGRSTITVSPNTRMHCSVLMSKIWDDTLSDQQRDKIKDMCNEYFVEQFSDQSFDSKLDCITALSCLLQGPYELGNSVLARAGVMEILLALADSKDVDHQLIAVEALVHATSKKDKCLGIVNTAIPILKKLYQTSANDNVKVRALVGMCKISSSSGTDASEKQLSDDSILSLSRSCRKFLANEAKNVDLRKWAVEGLAYLTLDAEVKEELIADPDSLKALVEIAKIGDQTVLFPAASVFVNLMNAYDKPEILPEMKQLAEYAKQKVPEEHPKDKEEFVNRRIAALVHYDVASAAVSLCKTESNQCKELLSRMFLAMVQDPKHRGRVVQQGGGKVLISLALKNSPEGMHLASQALAKMAITINPEVAFPGQRILEVVRPLLKLLHPDRTALQNFESLMALTNITSISDSARKRVVSEHGLASIEIYMYDDHEMLQRAATECMCNMVMNEEVAKLCTEDNDRVKLFTLFCGDEQFEVQRAACGALAILSSSYPKEIAEKIRLVNKWQDLMLQVLVSEQPDLQHRACHLIANCVEASEGFAQDVVNSQLFEILMAISKLPTPEHKSAKSCAEDALKAFAKYGFARKIS